MQQKKFMHVSAKKLSFRGLQIWPLKAKDDPRRVVLVEMRVICEGRPEDVVFRCETEDDKKKIKDTPFVLKEGCNYKITLSFRVQHEIVTGLKYVNTVYRKGIKGKL